MPRSTFSAVVLAAGKGTRMRSGTAKVLHPLCGRPLGYYPVRAALDANARRVVVVVGHQGDEVQAALEAALPKAPLVFVRQAEQRGTGHAVRCALPALGSARKVLVLYGDVPLVPKKLLGRLAQSRGAVSLVTARPPDATGYGRIVRDGKGRVQAIVEHGDASAEQRRIEEVNAGIYFVDRPILEAALGGLGAKNVQGELYLTDVVALAAKRGAAVRAIVAPVFEEVAGVNDRVELARAAAAMRRRINEALMRAGVTFEDPATTYVDEGVAIGADTVLGPGVVIRGETRIGKGAEIRAHTVVESSTVGAGCILGPMAHLRPGSVLEREVHVGNFVETKKSHLARGVKANHLTYLGDATVGARTNVGAGTITCNYDGTHKHETRIGAAAFIGSNTALVAPVEVGDRAYVGAGSTITDDVPPDALAVARGRQVNLAGWARRRPPPSKKKRR